MKKIFLTSLFLVILSLNSVYAGWWEINATEIAVLDNTSWENSTILQGVKTTDIKDKTLQTALDFNSDIILQNNIIEDYDYNNTHFFTKKIKLSWDISNDIKDKLTKVYLVWFLNNWQVYNHKSISSMIWNSKANFYSEAIDKNQLTSDYILKVNDLQKYIVNEYGDSFTFVFYWEFANWDKFPLNFANNYVYINNNKNIQSKKDFLSNLYFTKYPDLWYVDFTEKLKPVFEKIKIKAWTTEKYVSTLKIVEVKLQKIILNIENQEKDIISQIKKEEDFALYLDLFWPVIKKYNLYNDINYALASEIKSIESDSIIDDLFNKE